MFLRRLASGAIVLAFLAGVQLFSPGTAHAAARILYYDAAQAQEFVSAVHEGARIWNGRVTSVQLVAVPAGRTPNIRVYADNGWPRTYSTSLGNGYWYMGRQAVNQGYYVPRISAHEFGHILGLPDRRTGLCADLMSGSSAPVSCRNPDPNTAEANRVQRNFGNSATVHGPAAYESSWR
jgi:snapalysin